jgi:hypothetical protein
VPGVVAAQGGSGCPEPRKDMTHSATAAAAGSSTLLLQGDCLRVQQRSPWYHVHCGLAACAAVPCQELGLPLVVVRALPGQRVVARLGRLCR